jgi:fucose permease
MTSQQKSYTLPMIIIGALFFIFGFVTWLNSVLIPFLQQACELTDFQAYLVTFAFYISYFVMAIPASIILKKTGYAKGMSIGLGIMALGSLVFIPGALTRAYPLFLLGLFMQATGMVNDHAVRCFRYKETRQKPDRSAPQGHPAADAGR